jgi:hypothetical protein
MKSLKILLLSTLGLCLLAGCSSTPVVIAPVGPAPASTYAQVENSKFFTTAQAPSPNDVADGWLKVFTATKTVPDGETYDYPHTGYRIYTESGKLLKYVPNHFDDMDQSATLLKIPAGKYKVSARSEPYNMVIVPIVIQAGKTTYVHLGAHWQAPSNTPTNEIVHLPDGRPVGWKSAVTDSVN